MVSSVRAVVAVVVRGMLSDVLKILPEWLICGAPRFSEMKR